MVNWTEDQLAAIETSGTDLLVAAAAGSGKTAVLVERIIQKLTNEADPVNIDEILVATFTNAAAEEMKSRIGLSLEQAIAKDPTSYHLKKQLSLLQRASISTLHAFCTQVVRQNAYLLDLDPAFRIGNEMEVDLIKQEVMGDMFEEMYGKEEAELAAFLRVVEMYSSDRSDVEAENVMLQLYTFAMQNPWPISWLENVAARYNVPVDVKEDDLPWLQMLKGELAEELASYREEMVRALAITEETDGPLPYQESVQSYLNIIDMATRRLDNWKDLQVFFEETKLKSLGRITKDQECDVLLKEKVQAIRKSFGDFFNHLKKNWFSRNLAAHLEDLRTLYPAIQELTRFVMEFKERFAAAKREKAIVDFLDLEHFCLAILMDQSSTVDEIIPSSVAIGYKQQFKEVLVDEYQDINLVQETILQMVSDQIGAGNMFMVGDVKQSVYRFRHADPTLFMEKYKRFQADPLAGKKIDLALNFRSRKEVLDSANYIFRQVFDETIGEIAYDKQAELMYGNKGYDAHVATSPEAELILIDNVDAAGQEETADGAEDLDKVGREARVYAKKIKEWIGTAESKPLEVMDKATGELRPVQYRDIVILQRSLTGLSAMMAELKKQGIPVHAEQRVGYFAAIEIQVMMSMLKVIDNPYQDIPLAAVLRSPIVGLNEEQLTEIRLAAKNQPFYVALQAFVRQAGEDAAVVKGFLEQLHVFRGIAKEGALSELIWHVYMETGYFDFVGGIPGGRQRQANLRALYDRARGFESTSFRGLFRFLRFIENMLAKKMDLGEASALSEQEDVVRIMTIHRSKGLEFPVVLMGRMDKEFNYMDLRKKYILDKQLGFATKFIDADKQITYPTLFHLALQKEGERKLLAEEMRVLYVALTRAKEKLVMVGNVKDFEKEAAKWQDVLDHPSWVLPNGVRKKARNYLALVGPALMRHVTNDVLHGEYMISRHVEQDITTDASKWKIEIVPGSGLESITTREKVEYAALEGMIRDWHGQGSVDEEVYARIDEKLAFTYPFEQATALSAKQSVTEIKRRQEVVDDNSGRRLVGSFQSTLVKRPAFMQTTNKLTASEIGTAMHTVMQHIPLTHPHAAEEVADFAATLVEREILTEEEKAAIDSSLIAQFFTTEIGQLMLSAENVMREVPFTYALPASEIYPDWRGEAEERVLIQGVVDCLIQTETGTIIVDYKTDTITGDVTDETKAMLKERYLVQVNLYKRALEAIMKEEIAGTYLYFFAKDVMINI